MEFFENEETEDRRLIPSKAEGMIGHGPSAEGDNKGEKERSSTAIFP